MSFATDIRHGCGAEAACASDNPSMSSFDFGSLAAPVEAVKTTPRVVLRAMRSWAGPFEPVYAKVLPVNSRCIEAVCAWIALQIELPVPRPMLLTMPASRMPRGLQWPFGSEHQAIVFATRAIDGALPLSRISSETSWNLIDRWDALPAAAVFDQLVANDDRTDGNILLGPRRDLWLIDHARSLGGGGQRLFSTDVTPRFENFFLSRLAGFPLKDRQRLRPGLMAVCARLGGIVPRVPYGSLLVPDDISMQIDDFLQRRLVTLQATVLQAVGLPDLYDNGDAPRALQ